MNHLIRALTLLLLATGSDAAEPDDPIVLSTHLQSGSYYYETTDTLLKEAFRRIGHKLVLREFPGERALVEADSGHTDGDAHRIFEILTKRNLENLVRVPEVQQYVSDYVWSHRIAEFDGRWESLKQYHVGVHRGAVYVAENAKKYAGRVTMVSKLDNLFRMLANDRFDLVITVPGNATVLKSDSLKASGIRAIGKPLTSLPIFTYLHKKHEMLAPKVAQALSDMKADGTYEELLNAIPR